MLLRELKRVANDCCFNPREPDRNQRIVLDVGSPTYWTVKAIELIRKAQGLVEGSIAYNQCIQEATSLLILTRAHIDDQSKVKKPKKARNNSSGEDNKSPETS